MTKNCKKTVLSVLLTLLLFVLGLCVFTACGETDDGTDQSVTYTVTVKLDETTAASGVRVSIKKGSVSFDNPKETDANGKAEFELAPDNYTVVLSKLPAHYNADGLDLSLTKDKTDLTVTLNENFSYKVYLVNPDGTPYYAEGVRAGICTLDNNCLAPQLIDEKGVARCEGEKTDYRVQLIGLPATVTFARDENDEGHENYYTGARFTAEETEMTITIYPLTALTLSDDTAMSDADKTATDYLDDEYGNFPAHKFTQELKAGDARAYKITAAIDGVYTILYPSKNTISFKKLGGNGNTVYYGMELELKAGENFYFTANASEAATAEFIVVSPVTTVTSVIGTGATVNLSFNKAGARAIVAFTPAEAGQYTATVQGTQRAYAEVATDGNVFAAISGDAEFKANASCTGKMTESRLGNKIYFAVALPAGVTLPAQLQLKIEKTGAVTDTVTKVAVTETLEKYAKPTGTELVPVPLDGTAEALTYDETDKYYRYGAGANAPVVTVLLTKADIQRFQIGGALVYLEMIDVRAGSYVYNVTTDEDKADVTKGDTILDYRYFLRGFENYDEKPGSHGNTLSIPAKKLTENYYANFVNEDGVYPLTQELKTFLEDFYKFNKGTVDYNVPDGTEATKWMFPLYYYAETTVADAIVGNYELKSFTQEGRTFNVGDSYQATPRDPQVTVAKDSATLTVTRTGFTLEDNLALNDSYFGDGWTKTNDTTYTFKYTLWEEEATLAVTFDGATGTLTVVDDGTNHDITYMFQKVTANA